jgi:hypothetical protein
MTEMAQDVRYARCDGSKNPGFARGIMTEEELPQGLQTGVGCKR